MTKFIAGAVFGFVIGMTTLVLADGYLMNWTVTHKVRQGNRIVTAVVCEDPFMWRSLSMIECD